MENCLDDCNKEVLKYILQCVILSRDLQKGHKFKDGDIVFYYDGHFSNIHRLKLRKNSKTLSLTNEVLRNTEQYNRGEEWGLLTGVYFWLPDKKKVMEMIKNERENKIKRKLDME